MADILSIDFRGSIRTKVNGSDVDTVEVANREVAGTLRFETTMTVVAAAANLQVQIPTSLVGVGKFVCISADIPITVSFNGTTNLIQTSKLLLEMATPYVATLYLSNANATDATVRIYIAG